MQPIDTDAADDVTPVPQVAAEYTMPRVGTADLRNDGPGPLDRHIETFVATNPIPAWWTALYVLAQNRSIFLSPEWMSTWISVYGASFRGYWVSWKHHNITVAGALFLVDKRRTETSRLRTLYVNATGATPMRSPLAEFNDILCIPSYDGAIVDEVVALLHLTPWERVKVDGYISSSILSNVVARLANHNTALSEKPAPYVDYLEYGANSPFNASLSSNTRSQISRCRRFYEHHYGDVTVSRALCLPDALAAFQHMTTLHNERWRRKGIAGSFSNPESLEFHRTLITKLWPSGAVDIVTVHAGDSPIGILYTFIDHGKVYFFQSGFTYQSDTKAKPGLLTHALVIDDYRTRGMREYDFMAGDAQYKRSLAKRERTMNSAVLYRKRNLVVQFYLIAKSVKSRCRHMVKNLKRSQQR